MKWLNSSKITDARLFALSFGGWLECARVAMKLCKNMGRKMQRKFVDLNSATNVRICGRASELEGWERERERERKQKAKMLEKPSQ